MRPILRTSVITASKTGGLASCALRCNHSSILRRCDSVSALALVRSLADRLAQDGIRINAISPGQIRTPMMAPTLDAVGDQRFTERILLERIGEPEEVGRVVRFLLSEEASYITAAEFIVDGGNVSSQRT